MKIVKFIRMLNINRMAINVTLIVILYIVVSTAEAEVLLGIKKVFMFDEKLQEFKSTGTCYLLEHGSSFNYKRFKLTLDGPIYDLCYAGSYVSEIDDGKATCKPCPDDTYNPFMNACPYCIVCRTCGHNQHELTACTPISDRTCQCKLGLSCQPGSRGEDIKVTHISRTENTIEEKLNTLNASTASHEAETNWKTVFIVYAAVSGCLVLVLIAVIYVLSRPKRYQPVKTKKVKIDDLSNGQNQPASRRMTTRDIDGDIGRLIEELAEKISKDYKKIGIALDISEEKLNRILQDNQGNFIDAIREMLNKARKQNGSRTRHVFMEAFKKSDRTDLAEIVQTDLNEIARKRSSASTALVEVHAHSSPV